MGRRRPAAEEGLISIRSELGVYANLRPARYGKVDLLIVRELLGGLYYGESGVRPSGTSTTRSSTTPTRSSASRAGPSSSRVAGAAASCPSTRRT